VKCSVFHVPLAISTKYALKPGQFKLLAQRVPAIVEKWIKRGESEGRAEKVKWTSLDCSVLLSQLSRSLEWLGRVARTSSTGPIRGRTGTLAVNDFVSRRLRPSIAFANWKAENELPCFDRQLLVQARGSGWAFSDH
jgi:hypothetical protein